MKRTILTAAVLLPLIAAAQTSLPYKELADPEINSINRCEARAYSMPLASEKDAFTTELEPATPFVKSLNGKWKIRWAGGPDRRPEGFWKAEYDDSNWQTIDVPSCVETRGFGTPGYTNSEYPHQLAAPLIKDFVFGTEDYNPVSSYRTTFTVPSDWEGRDVFIRFDGVYSAYHLWINGEIVGYAEDSKLPSEFNISKYLKKGDNLLAVEVFRWCDGSYLEDQDMFRFSGIFRDVTLIAMPKEPIRDFFFRTRLTNNYRDAEIILDVDAASKKVSATLYDAKFRKVASFSGSHSKASLRKAHLWSAEDPYLYTLVIKSGDDIRSAKVGVKQIERSGNTVLVNGQKIKFKGVNRHEHSALNGRTVSREEMLEDILLMKRHNINTVRTCHYPDHHTWYDLCDKYGIYLMAEANVEGHGYGYETSPFSDNKEWKNSIVERNVNQVLNYRNHPSILFWSLGNETKHGANFVDAAKAVKDLDPTRLVHWERGNVAAEVDSKMYPSVDWLYLRGKLGDGVDVDMAEFNPGKPSAHTKGKPFFLCEYAHAMGNAIGNFKEYWEAFYSSDALLGGCIWDWVDQALLKDGHWLYGADFDEIPNSGPFCCNGVIRPDRKVTAKLVEVAHVHRQLVVSSEDASTLKAELWNRFSFTNADAFDGRWSLLEDGVEVASGKFNVPSVKPLQKTAIDLPKPAYSIKPGKEYFYNVYFSLREPTLWAEKGHIIASDQLVWKNDKKAAAKPKAKCTPVLSEDDKTITVTTGDITARFCKRGQLLSLQANGKELLASLAGAAPQLSWNRALTDNDIWIRNSRRPYQTGDSQFKYRYYSYGLTQPRAQVFGLKVRNENDGKVIVSIRGEMTGAKTAGFEQTERWIFNTDGSVVIEEYVKPFGRMPETLPRLGLSMVLDKSLNNMTWYGRGPWENYIDRNSGSFIGKYSSSVAGQIEEYVRPQDNSYKSDVRWVSFTDQSGKGVKFSGNVPLFVQAINNTWEEMEFGRHRAGEQRRLGFLTPREEIYLNLDIRQLGLGGASCGPTPMKKYVSPVQNEHWSIKIEAVK